ncbi:hypothetical protein ACGIF2_05420 [Cellulomonas sp. P22]|uniref:hypothetical protein n=1 Tax=Cellulomonas sp. P22 TaxID=3373189 RepID=UPI0037904B57
MTERTDHAADDAPTSAVARGHGPADGAAGDAPAAVMDLLAEHVPLALLADLVAVGGPASREILESEGLPGDAWWVDPDAPQA